MAQKYFSLTFCGGVIVAYLVVGMYIEITTKKWQRQKILVINLMTAICFTNHQKR